MDWPGDFSEARYKQSSEAEVDRFSTLGQRHPIRKETAKPSPVVSAVSTLILSELAPRCESVIMSVIMIMKCQRRSRFRQRLLVSPVIVACAESLII
jgi:hypothetical protein